MSPDMRFLNTMPVISGLVVALCIFAQLTSPARSADWYLEPPSLPPVAFSYPAPNLPAHLKPLAQIDTQPASNPVTDAGATLGRVLFFDRHLSANDLVSCGSCHAQSMAFDDPTQRSIGLRGKLTRRAAMMLANNRYNPGGHQFRDSRADTLEEQVLMPFFDPIEMDLAPGQLVSRVEERQWYAALFEAAFGDGEISEERIARSLAQFVRSMVALDTRYDAERAKVANALEPFEGFTAQENRGKALFFNSKAQGGLGCALCHSGEGFVLREPTSNGLLPQGSPADRGVGEITGREVDMWRFRTTSLRNITTSPPYMHDGRFATLEQVLGHYDKGITAQSKPDELLLDETGNPQRLNLSQQDRAAVIAFLFTLTDHGFLADQRFSDPFLATAQ
ncbi:MAG: cytochrome c peroxidase [Rhizobiaceae bacterium]